MAMNEKPKCPLIGADGNIFNLLGMASRTLRENGMREQAQEMQSRVTASGSYSEALNILGEYTAFDNLMILWYNEEEGIFEEMPTDRDISLEIERNRKYLDKIMVRPPSADDKDVFDQITATMKSTEGSMRWDLSNCIDTFVNRSRADYRALP